SSISQIGLTANWNAVTGATNYYLDVSTSSVFAALLTGYNNLSVTGISQVVTALSAGTTYYYRVRLANASGSSNSSGTITTLTVPANPIASAATAVSSTSFTAVWAASTSATGYLLDVSTDNFSTFISGFNNLAVSGTSAVLSGLSPATSYQYRVRATNAS